MADYGNLSAAQISNLISTAVVDESPRSFITQSKQLVAFSVIALIYANRSNWSPTEAVSPETRIELSEAAKSLNIEKVAYQTFIVHVRRMMRKFCEGALNDEQFSKVKNSPNAQAALVALLALLATKNIFTAGHMRIWAGSPSMEPLDLSRLRSKEVRQW